MSALEVRDLRKSYGANEAVAGISFTVEEGEVFGLLGPNGAGKTTTVEILEGYRKRDGGEVTVLGVDPEHGGSALRERIGVVLQTSELPAALTVREVHRMFAGYYERPRDIDEVIGLVGLEEKAGARVKIINQCAPPDLHSAPSIKTYSSTKESVFSHDSLRIRIIVRSTIDKIR